MKKLTNREIVRIHDMARVGVRPYEISRELQISRNTVTAHLLGDITYCQDIRRRISQECPLVADGWLCRRMAAPWIPGHPSPAKMRVLMTTTSWMRRVQKPPLKSVVHAGRRVTKIEWIARFVAKHYPTGIWIRVETLRTYSSPYADLGAIPTVLGRRLLGYPLHLATRLADATDKPLEIPPALIHRAVQIERRVGMALV